EGAAPAKTKAKKAAKEPKPKKTSALDAAAKVLAESGEAMTMQAMIEAMATKGYWSSPGGQTPSATLYSAILRELATKGEQARFGAGRNRIASWMSGARFTKVRIWLTRARVTCPTRATSAQSLSTPCRSCACSRRARARNRASRGTRPGGSAADDSPAPGSRR